MGGIIYISAYDYIHEKPFRVNAPAFYHPHIDKNLVNPPKQERPKVNQWRMTPTRTRPNRFFDHVIDPMQMQVGSFTIEILIDMFQKKIEFELVDEDDIVDIFEGIDRYLMAIQEAVTLREEAVVNYAKLVIAFRAEMYKHYFRYMMTNPAAREALASKSAQNLINLMDLTSGLRKGGKRNEKDPLRAKAFPPYDIDPPVEEVSPEVALGTTDTALADAYGIKSAASNILNDDSFDMDDFLRKR